MGKLGGFVGVFTFPFLLRWHGLLSAESAAAIVSGLGAITTVFLLPESKGKSLDEIEPELETPFGACRSVTDDVVSHLQPLSVHYSKPPSSPSGS